MRNKLNKGFTLLELLVVIALLSIIMAVIIVGIDPIDKVNSANDAKVQADIAEIGTALEAYATLNGTYPTSQDVLLQGGELRSVLTPPTGYCGVSNSYSFGAGGSSQYVTCWNGVSGLRSKKYSATPKWIWCSSTGRASAETGVFVCPE